jgi:tellurite resistance protein TehA-like permease
VTGSPAFPARSGLSVRGLPPNIFAAVMATGIVSVALNGAGHPLLAVALFWLNVGLYAVLSVLLVASALRYRADLVADLLDHAKAPGFFTLVAAPCVLGNQCVLLFGAYTAGLVLGVVGLLFWLAATYVMLPGLMEGTAKPKGEVGLSGAWLLLVVGTQALSTLACLLVPGLPADALPGRRSIDPEGLLFLALVFWLVGSMFYIWLIALIFHRILFLPLSPTDLTPSYWINMGAVAISTLAGVRLVEEAGRAALFQHGGESILTGLLPFLKGMTLLFWATATWWIPLLLVLGAWRHLYKRVPLTYEHSYWAVVFPLGMYTACTQNLIRVFRLPFLEPIPAVFVWIALAAWGATFVGLAGHVVSSLRSGTSPSSTEVNRSSPSVHEGAPGEELERGR